jgi:putative tryptophan/tyrosine transport system substrate-binding protein
MPCSELWGLAMRRRDFVKGITGSAIGWPLVAGAQQPERVRRIGILSNKTSDDPEGHDEVAAFLAVLDARGWRLGRNLQIDYRWGAGNGELYGNYAVELVKQAPDLLLAPGGTVTGALQRATRDIPIVFVETTDPVDRGLVASLSQPGGNTTGFLQFDFAITGKWLELLKEIAPKVTRVAVIRDPSQFSGVAEVAAIQAVASSQAVDIRVVDARDIAGLETALVQFARQGNGGLIVTPSGTSIKNRDHIIALAAQQHLPAIYSSRFWPAGGGLICYGSDVFEQYRRAADYVDRIFKGEKPAELPVQAPTKYQLVINLKTAKALGLVIPQTLLARADEVIE